VTSRRPSDEADNGSDDRRHDAVSLVVSEYEFVESLIPVYRHFELSVLAGAGLVMSAVIAAVAAIESGDDPNRDVEAILFATAAWAPVFLLLLEIVALTRIRRASLYITRSLRPLARELTTEEKRLLCWERAPTADLFEETLAAAQRTGRGPIKSLRRLLVSEGLVRFFVSSTPLILVIFALSALLAVLGAAVRPWTLAIGLPAVVISAALAVYGIEATGRHEGREAEHDVSEGHAEPREASR